MYSVFTGPAFRSPEKLTAVVPFPRLGVLVPTSSPHSVQGAQEANGPLTTAWLIQENDVDEVAQWIAQPALSARLRMAVRMRMPSSESWSRSRGLQKILSDR